MAGNHTTGVPYRLRCASPVSGKVSQDPETRGGTMAAPRQLSAAHCITVGFRWPAIAGPTPPKVPTMSMGEGESGGEGGLLGLQWPPACPNHPLRCGLPMSTPPGASGRPVPVSGHSRYARPRLRPTTRPPTIGRTAGTRSLHLPVMLVTSTI
ncbi:hypothetical protein NDU88_005865 [Pleurodeles waltl]|uniref:Uncharacterized protein n=1 Tax=Pleurodeles waltl TaxID=8319 RepID=A0AAV7WBW5_PLEWA|nr:hypothetical protein NDU88_005865 [Pleurodeles waltl]